MWIARAAIQVKCTSHLFKVLLPLNSHFQWTKTVYTDIADGRLKWGYSISWQAGHFLSAHSCLFSAAIKTRAEDTAEQTSCLYDPISKKGVCSNKE